jgi:S-DNA-T family DNA segregation ATPase FtsK/SpoIIIE
MLQILAMQSITSGHDVTIIDIGAGQLTSWANENDIKCLTDADQLFDWLKQTIPEFSRRHAKIKQAGGSKFSDVAMADEKQIVILIHDFGELLNAIYNDARDMVTFFENMVKHGNNHKIAMFACVTREDSLTHGGKPTYTGFISWKSGIHFGGQIDNQRIFEFDISPSVRSKRLPVGYGYTFEKERTVIVVTPEV